MPSVSGVSAATTSSSFVRRRVDRRRPAAALPVHVVPAGRRCHDLHVAAHIFRSPAAPTASRSSKASRSERSQLRAPLDQPHHAVLIRGVRRREWARGDLARRSCSGAAPGPPSWVVERLLIDRTAVDELAEAVGRSVCTRSAASRTWRVMSVTVSRTGPRARSPSTGARTHRVQCSCHGRAPHHRGDQLQLCTAAPRPTQAGAVGCVSAGLCGDDPSPESPVQTGESPCWRTMTSRLRSPTRSTQPGHPQAAWCTYRTSTTMLASIRT